MESTLPILCCDREKPSSPCETGSSNGRAAPRASPFVSWERVPVARAIALGPKRSNRSDESIDPS